MGKSIFIKLIISLMMSILIIGTFCPQSSHAIGDMISDGKDFLEKGKDPYDYINKNSLESTSNDIYNVLLAFAIVIAVIVAMILGIQFMVASADEKAKVKEALMPFVVGCIVVFGSFTIWKVAVNLGNEAEGEIQTSGYYENDGDHGLSEYYDFCKVCGTKVTSSDERHEKKCKSCKASE